MKVNETEQYGLGCSLIIYPKELVNVLCYYNSYSREQPIIIYIVFYDLGTAAKGKEWLEIVTKGKVRYTS